MSPTPSLAGGEPRLLRALSRLNRALCDGAAALASIALLVSLALIGWAVSMRYIINRPPVWTDDAVGFLLVAIVMLAAAQVLQRHEHISVDIFTERLSGRWASAARGWGALAALVVSVILVVNGWETAMQSRQFGIMTEGRLELPVWWLMLFMPLGGSLMTLVSIESLWRLALGLPSPVAAHPHGQHGSDE